MLKAQNLHKSYNAGNKSIEVLKGVDLMIQPGEFVAIVGPSGAGKSTLLHVLGGLDYPDQGKVYFDETDIYALSEDELCRLRNKRIGFVFQFYHLLSEFRVWENIFMPAWMNKEIKKSSVKNLVLELLDQTGLSLRSKHFPNQLSGGEQQRVAIVRALVNQPELLLCDEPTGNLDSETGEGIISLIKKINAQRRMSVVLVTHNQELANKADRVYHLKDGMLVDA